MITFPKDENFADAIYCAGHVWDVYDVQQFDPEDEDDEARCERNNDGDLKWAGGQFYLGTAFTLSELGELIKDAWKPKVVERKSPARTSASQAFNDLCYNEWMEVEKECETPMPEHLRGYSLGGPHGYD